MLSEQFVFQVCCWNLFGFYGNLLLFVYSMFNSGEWYCESGGGGKLENCGNVSEIWIL